MDHIIQSAVQLLFSPYPLLLLPLFFLLRRLTTAPSSLPPGPRPWPIVGNIPHITKNLHISLAHFAKLHGPLISLKLGSQLLVVASTPAAAAQVLKYHDRSLSARHIPQAVPYEVLNVAHLTLIWADCNEKWKSLRSLCRTELFSAKAIENQTKLREKKVMEMVEFLEKKEGEIVNLGEIVFATIFNILGNVVFSRDFFELGDDSCGEAGGLKELMWKMMVLGSRINVSDLYPIFADFDLQGLRKEAAKCLKQMHGVWEIILKERREKINGYCDDGARERDFLDVFLANGFDDDQINILVFELFTAGTETTTTTLEWAMAELLKNRAVMKKLQEEINGNTIKEEDIIKLPYLNACVKESLRLHPSVPLLLPHKATNTCEVMNFTIPKNSEVLVNVWAIGRDPTIWKEPLEFNPDRFLESKLDFKGQDFELTPFGAGRRMCPGLPMAERQLSLILSNLVSRFNWDLPNGEEDHVKLDMKEKFGLTLHRQQPLLITPNRRGQK